MTTEKKKVVELNFGTPDTSGNKFVNSGMIQTFGPNVPHQIKQDILDSCLYCQKDADSMHRNMTPLQAWYDTYTGDMRDICDWVMTGYQFTEIHQKQSGLSIAKWALDFLLSALGGAPLLEQAIKDLAKVGNNKALKIFDFNSTHAKKGGFQLSKIEMVQGFATMSIGAFYYESTVNVKELIGIKYNVNNVKIFGATQKVIFNEARYKGDGGPNSTRQQIIKAIEAVKPHNIHPITE